MPRLKESRTWNILKEVPADHYRLVKEALSLRQKIVATRQIIHFLCCCRRSCITPNFITSKRLHVICGLPEDSPHVKSIEQQLLKMAIRSKRVEMYTCLKKCIAKEMCCQRIVPERLWNRVVGESKNICDLIRSKAKARLQDKFDRLVDQQRYRRSRVVHRDNLSNVSHQQTFSDAEHLPKPRVTVLGNITLSSEALSLLELGPSFAPVQSITPRVARKTVGNLQTLLDRLRCRANTARREDATDLGSRCFPALPFPTAYYRPQEPHPVVDTKFRLFATSVYNIMQQHAQKRTTSNLTPSQRRGFKEVRDRIRAGDIRLSISDKGGEFVILPQALDRAIAQLHLQDETLYCKTTEKEYTKQYRRLNRCWSSVAKVAGLSNTIISRLKCDLPLCPTLYVLIKTHKLTAAELSSNDPSVFKVRPIISNVGGPTDRISWFLNIILAQLLKYIPVHLTNTKMLLEKLSSTSLQEDIVMESFDVTSLYTNMSNEAALEATYNLLCEHERTLNLYRFSISQIMSMLDECLKCSIFRWSGEYYKQLRGLAMGQRLAPVLAIAFMAKVEKPVMDRKPVLYMRYIDDCIIMCSTQREMDACFDLLNDQADRIHFTREKPTENWLPFLNVQIQLSKGTFRTKWYRKPSNKNILIHYQSAHPVRMKQAVVGSMFKTATIISSDAEFKKESLNMAHSIARSNGYPYTGSQRRGYQTPGRDPARVPIDKVSFYLPFISEEMRKAIRPVCTDVIYNKTSGLWIYPQGISEGSWSETVCTTTYVIPRIVSFALSNKKVIA